MSCIIIGSNHQAALEHCYKKYLLASGIDVSIFPAQQRFLEYYHKSLLNKVLVRAGLSGIYRKISDELKLVIEQKKPDWIWVFKGMEILPETIQWIKSNGIKVINFNPDNPLVFSGPGSGNRNVTKSIPLFDCYLSYDQQTVQQLQDRDIYSALLPFGHDVEDTLYKTVTESTTEKVKACFLGMPDKYRAAFLEQLATSGVEIDCYGNNWSKWTKHERIQCYPGRYGNEFWCTLYQYRVQLNYMRLHNPHSHNMRSFEIPAIGGIQLAPRTADHATYFDEGREIFLYDNVNDCVQKIQQLLQLNKVESKDIRQNARARSTGSGYSYACRTKQVLKIIEQLF